MKNSEQNVSITSKLLYENEIFVENINVGSYRNSIIMLITKVLIKKCKVLFEKERKTDQF